MDVKNAMNHEMNHEMNPSAFADRLLALAAQQGVRLTRLADYGVMETGKELERVVLLGFAGMDEEAIGEGLNALRRAWI